jgi:type IV pilus assembly protein PilB
METSSNGITIVEISSENQQLIRSDIAWHYRILPQSVSEDEVTFFWDQTGNALIVKEELTALFGKTIRLVSVDSDVIKRALGKYYRNTSDGEVKLTFDAKIDFVDRLIQEANHLGSSDIHIEIYDDYARVRIRIDGHLIQRYTIEKKDYPELINKIKIRSNLDISEKRLPQDGRIQYEDFDIRISILPTLYGEKIVMPHLSALINWGSQPKKDSIIWKELKNRMELY